MSHRSASVAQHKQAETSPRAVALTVEDDAKAPQVPAPPAHPTVFGIEIRFLVLPLLTAQNASAVLLMRAVRSLPGQTEFSTLTAVIMQEVFKLLACIVILMMTEGTVSSAWNKPVEALKTSVPALLYLFQNNVQFLAVTILDAATYTVSYQSKTLWTGVLTVLLLGRHLTLSKWTAIAMLTIGVTMVNLGGSAKSEVKSVHTTTSSERFYGLVLINAAAVASSLAGVYFEKILKEVKVSLWTRNLQLAFYSILTGYFTLMVSPSDWKKVQEHGFFHGYTAATWVCVAVNAFGGLLCGAVIKYADAVSKDVSIGASIVLSTTASIFLFGYLLTTPVIFGIVLVIYSVFIYSGNARNPLEICFGSNDRTS
eukprot:TRINITY_DN782_c0_g1_i1.p1 TRINITY_DN782_c0_g1~~TRINITY_DN782_c0_g1_i1.p1  ORF type:complete len:369 (+),score=109.30 TRINITY_DN782_c0_g1_i1:110-1216(+)